MESSSIIDSVVLDDSESHSLDDTDPSERVSLYVQGFDFILDKVLENESHLFLPDEQVIFAKYRSLSYETRFLFVRLFMRKRAKWFRVNALQYYNDISDLDKACNDLVDVHFAYDTKELERAGIHESLSLLSLDELKTLATLTKCTSRVSNKSKIQLYTNLCQYANEQCYLGKRVKLKDTTQSTINSYCVLQRPTKKMKHDTIFRSPSSPRSPLMRRIISITGLVIRLDQNIVDMFARLHVVFFRTTSYTESSMTVLVLARISKRIFPTYKVRRSLHVFTDRKSLIEYINYLKLESEMEECIENINDTKSLNRAQEIFNMVYPEWKKCLLNPPSCTISYFLLRFTPAWVMTSIIYRGTYVISRQKAYIHEVCILKELLDQNLFFIGKRGAMYDRLALIQMNHLEGDKRIHFKSALATCEQALADPMTHFVWHDSLQRRIIRLEKALMIRKKDRHDFSYVKIKSPMTRVIQGERLDDPETGKKSVWRRPINCVDEENNDDILDDEDNETEKQTSNECSVEELCLMHYTFNGWKGFHSENGIMTTIFGLLFWDILFLDIPGAFEMEFQTSPMDLRTDSFYIMRASEINQRLMEIANGEFSNILSRIDDAERPKGTWCVGVRWDYSKEDLLEIIHCIGGQALSTICRLFAQEYGYRVGGLPDLCLWRMDEKRCMFVEVKGPGDRLSETQRTWIDALLGAGVDVELCKVEYIKEINDIKSEIRKHLESTKCP